MPINNTKRLFSMVVAGTKMMTGHSYYFYIPIVGACMGGVAGL
jgi:glycerol uptake facilitator-like aquaporin